jgi:beta-glucosidase
MHRHRDASRPAYLDPSKPTEQRIADLIGRMMLGEKAQQLNHLNVGIPRLKVAAWGGWNQTLHGVWSKQPKTLFAESFEGSRLRLRRMRSGYGN